MIEKNYSTQTFMSNKRTQMVDNRIMITHNVCAQKSVILNVPLLSYIHTHTTTIQVLCEIRMYMHNVITIILINYSSIIMTE